MKKLGKDAKEIVQRCRKNMLGRARSGEVALSPATPTEALEPGVVMGMKSPSTEAPGSREESSRGMVLM